MAYYRIKYIYGKPYKYRQKSRWNRHTKRIESVMLKYLGRATQTDVDRYYKGSKYAGIPAGRGRGRYKKRRTYVKKVNIR